MICYSIDIYFYKVIFNHLFICFLVLRDLQQLQLYLSLYFVQVHCTCITIIEGAMNMVNPGLIPTRNTFPTIGQIFWKVAISQHAIEIITHAHCCSLYFSLMRDFVNQKHYVSLIHFWTNIYAEEQKRHGYFSTLFRRARFQCEQISVRR